MDKRGVKVMFAETYGAQTVRHWRKHEPEELAEAWAAFCRELMAAGWITQKQFEKWGQDATSFSQ